MQKHTDSGGAEPDEATSLPGAGEALELAGTALPEAGGRVRSRLATGWRFMRHLLEMVVAMMIGMGLFGLALALVGEPLGYANLLVRYGAMGAFMAAPMVAWMRYRGHPWSDGGEMTAAMVVPMLALAAPVELGVEVPGLSEGSLMMLSHVAMIGGMVALMVYRFDRYAQGTREARPSRARAGGGVEASTRRRGAGSVPTGSRPRRSRR